MCSILHIYDNPDDRAMVQGYLQGMESPVQLTSVGTLHEGFQVLRRAYQPDLVILDLNLPETSGLVTYGKLRQVYKGPVITLAGSTQEVREELQNLTEGVHLILQKDNLTAERLCRYVKATTDPDEVILETQRLNQQLKERRLELEARLNAR